MKLRFNVSDFRKMFNSVYGRLSQKSGNILVYVVMIMVIFAVLGVAMVSLFSTSISSSATANDSRRAFYCYESGLRYASSELVNNVPDFSSTTINHLNTIQYKIPPSASFKFKIFGFNFESPSKLNPGTHVNLVVDKGALPDDFNIPTTGSPIFLVNYVEGQDSDSLSPDAESAITGFTYQDDTHVSLDLSDDFVVGAGKPVAFAVRPFQDDSINQGGSLLLTRNAVSIFPRRNGAIRVNGKPYFYDDRIDNENPNYAKLTNIKNPNNQFPLNVSASSTYVILAPEIYIITAEGKSRDVVYTEKWNDQYGGSVYDRQDVLGRSAESRKPDIEFDEEANLPSVLSRAPDPGVVNVYDEPGNKYLSLNASGGFFGAVWFKDTRPIGGARDFCDQGGCFFNNGFRAFFIFNFTGTGGDGFTFSVLNQSNNTVSSVGGDIDLSELLAYAGDSRKVSNPTSASDFLDGRSGLGLQAPKMAVEFDGRKNNQSQTICQDATHLNLGSRFDPDFSGNDRDAVQYVFWGRDELINAPCRINPLTATNKTYDDNQHGSLNAIWIYNSGSERLSSPAIDASDPMNVRIYTGRSAENTQNDGGRLIRLRASDGAELWSRNPDTTSGNDDDINAAPVLDISGNIYIGGDSNLMSKYRPDGTKDEPSIALDNDIEAKAAVSDGQNAVYVVTENGSLYALTKSLTLKWAAPIDIGPTQAEYTSIPTIRFDAGLNKNIVYVGSLDGRLYAVRDDGAAGFLLFSFLTGGAIHSTPAINPVNAEVYFGSDNGTIYAITSLGSFRWQRAPAPVAAVVSSPAVTPDGGTLYVGANNGHLYALNTLNGTERWKYPDPVRTPGDPVQIGEVRSDPLIASDGAIYFGSDDGHLYALNPDGTLRWKYPATGSPIGRVRSKPAIGPDGVVYFAADDGKLYALNSTESNPPNIPNLYLTSAELGASVSDANNWLSDGPWAVRIEVQRSQTPNVSGKFVYTLKTWLKKCQDANCLQDVGGLNLVGGFFQNTRFGYDWTTAGITPMTQVIELSNDFHTDFNRFLFGFTSASEASQTIEIRKFQLSFIRPNDPVQSD